MTSPKLPSEGGKSEILRKKGTSKPHTPRGVKTETTIKIKPRRDDLLIGKGLEGIFDLLFYRKPSLGLLALKFVEYVISRQKLGTPMNISEWQQWIKENDVSQKQFYNITNKLTGVGMLRKEEGVYICSNDFSRTLNMMADIWDARRQSIAEDQRAILQ